MRFRGLLLAAVLLALACSPHESAPRNEAAAIETVLKKAMATSHIPGMAVAVLRDGAVVREFTYGLADVAAKTPVTRTTPFQIASTTKSFSSVAVLLLVADGKVQLSDRIGDHVPDLPEAWRGVTIRQLLSHTSGLPDVVRVPGQLDLLAGTWKESLALVAHAPMQFAPGTNWAYTQTNYVLLAQVVERRSGISLEEFMTARLFRPLVMNDTFYPTESRRCATNYELGAGAKVRSLDFPPFVHAAGGLCSSLADLERWNQALDAGKVLRADLASELWTRTRLANGALVSIDGRTLGYGLGWVVDDAPGHRFVGHSGGNSTAYRRYLDDHLTIVVLHNGVHDPDGLVSSIASILTNRGGDDSAQERLWDAAIDGDTDAIEKAIADGADVEALDTRKSRNGRRALNWAAFNDHPDAIRALLKHGAKIDAANLTGFTALHHAAEAGAEDAARALLDAGANRTLKTSSGETPAATARRKGHESVAVLIERAK